MTVDPQTNWLALLDATIEGMLKPDPRQIRLLAEKTVREALRTSCGGLHLCRRGPGHVKDLIHV